MTYEVVKTARGVFVNKILDDGITVGFMIGTNEKLLTEFLEWNDEQLNPIDISVRPLEPSAQEKRKVEYEKQGITIEALTIALWESMFEGRTDNAAEIQAKRAAIKEQFPAQTAQTVKG